MNSQLHPLIDNLTIKSINNENKQQYHSYDLGFIAFKRIKIYILFFLEFYIFYDNNALFLDFYRPPIFLIPVYQEPRSFNIPILCNKAESALFRSVKSVEISSFSEYINRNSLKKLLMSSAVYS